MTDPEDQVYLQIDGGQMTEQEINVEVAKRLCRCDSAYCGCELKDYCHDIKAAWQIVELMAQKYSVHVIGGLGMAHWHCDVYKHPAENPQFCISESALTVPRAICEAFLKLEDK